MRFDKITRRIPGHVWVRIAGGRIPACEPGHGWVCSNILRRDAWRVGDWVLVVLRMPKRQR